jgi:AcrR family transcriptional regulator
MSIWVMTSDTPSPFPDSARREATRQAKRQAVLLAAVRMFNEHGFHATSLDDVAASLGITKPTIYHYLGTKDQVLFECVTIGLRQLLEAAQAARERPGTGADRLRIFLENYARVNMGDFGRCVIRTGDESLSPESAAKFRSLKREIDDALRAMIREAVADRSIAAVDERIAAFTFAGALNWPARWFRADGEESADAVARAMVKLLMEGCTPRA